MKAVSRLLPLCGVIILLALVVDNYSAQVDTGGNEGGSGTAEPASASGSKDDARPAADSAEALLQEVTTPEMIVAIKEGLQQLARLQNDDGSFGVVGTKIATTSLAGLALLASGSVPDSGPYALSIRKAIDYILGMQDPNNGYIAGGDDGSRIHGHGYATLFLSQAYGHSNEDRRIKVALDRAVSRLEAGQTKDGGWGYVPDDKTWDEGSTTICAIQALRGSQDAGISVKNSTIANAIGYIEKIAVPRTFQSKDGKVVEGYTFMYSLSSGFSSDSWALVAASVSVLNNIGVYSASAKWNQRNIGSILRGGMLWLRYSQGNFIDRYQSGNHSLDTAHFDYANFYACQACWQYSDVSYFRHYFPKMRDILVEQGANSGYQWRTGSYGPAYATALSLLTLQVPYQYLPIFQR